MQLGFRLIVILGLGVGLVGCGRPKPTENTAHQEKEAPQEKASPQKKATIEDPVEEVHPVLAKLESMTIPIVDFNNTTLEEAIDFLRIRSIELDPEPEMQNRGVSFVIRSSRLESDEDGLLGGFKNPAQSQFSFQAENINFLDALVEISKLAGIDLYLTTGGFLGVPEGTAPVHPLPKGGKILKVIRKK